MTESRPATDKKLKIFISYSRKDMDFAGRLEAALKARGIECLIDRTEIYAFEDWWKRIQALIIQTDTVIFILSPDAIASDVCKKEIKFAASLNKRFAPIVHRRVDVEAVPMELAQLNFVFFDDETAFDASVDRLTDALKTNIDWVRRHTNLGASARAWDGAKRPNGLLLRSPALEEAEQWIASRPPGAPEPTPETRSFIANSRTASTRRRNIIAASSLAGLVLAVALAIFANWQRQKAAVSEEAAQLARIEAEKKRDDALRSESLALGTQAISAITGDQKIKAFQLASAGLPRLWAQPDRPIVELALQAFIRAFAALPAISRSPLVLVPHNGSNLTSIRLSKDGQYLLTTAWDGTARIWSLPTFENNITLQWYHGATDEWFCRIVTSADITHDANLVATSNLDGNIRIWNRRDGKLLIDIIASVDKSRCSAARWGARANIILSVNFSADGSKLMSSSADGTVAIWEVETGRLLHQYLHSRRVNAAYFDAKTQDSAILIDDKGLLRKYLFGSNSVVFEARPCSRLLSLAFGHRGAHALVTCADGTSRLYNLDTGSELRRFTGHSHLVSSGSFGPNDAWLATGSDDGTVRLWDTETGATFATLPIGEQITGVAVEPKKGTVFITAFDGKLHVWNDDTGLRALPVGQVISAARSQFSQSPWGHASQILDANHLHNDALLRRRVELQTPSCDQADDPDDPSKVQTGIEALRLNLSQASEVCKRDIRKQAGGARYKYNLGRILMLAGNFYEAEILLRGAMKEGSSIAKFLLADLIREGRVSGTFEQVLELLSSASDSGVGIASWRLAGLLWRGREGLPVDKTGSIAQALLAAKAGVPAAHAWLGAGFESDSSDGSMEKSLFSYTVAAEQYERFSSFISSELQHANRARVSLKLPAAVSAEMFDRAIAWRAGDQLPLTDPEIGRIGDVFKMGPDEGVKEKVFDDPKIADRTIDACLRSSLAEEMFGDDPIAECSLGAKKAIASQFCRSQGFTTGNGKTIDTGSVKQSVKLVIEAGPGLSLNPIWAQDNRGGTIFSEISCN